MSNLAREIFDDYKEENNILDASIENINLFKKSNKLEIYLKSEKRITLKEINDFEAFLKKRFNISEVVFYIENNFICDEYNSLLQNDWDNIAKYICNKYPLLKAILKGSKVEIEGANLNVILKTANTNFLHSYNFDKELQNMVSNLYGKKLKIVYKEAEDAVTAKEQMKYLEKLEQRACESLIDTVVLEPKVEEVVVKEETKEEKKDTPLILGRSANIKEQVIKIADLTSDYGKVALEGKVIDTDSRELKNGKILGTFNLYDGTSTITCKSFLEKEKADEVLDRIKKSGRLKIQGNAQYDTFAKEITVIANVIVELPTVEITKRRDNAEVKRVELHMHTQMSQMDGMSSATDLIKRAASWGMKSIAITDHGVVQAFPEANHAASDFGIKVIYGVEAYFVPDEDYEELQGEGWRKSKAYHAIILVKNYKGLRNLYELISISHLNYYHKRPRILQSVFNKYKEGLILGSACEQGELYQAILNKKPEEEIEKIASRYDYMEIQPLGNNDFMLRDGKVESKEELINIVEEVISIVKPESPKDFGKIMKEITPKVKNRCDMKELNELIKNKLQ